MRKILLLSWVVLTLLACKSTEVKVARGPASLPRIPEPVSTFTVYRNPLNPFVQMQRPYPSVPFVIGGYSAGCIGGAAELPKSGPGYEVQRISRRRYFGHPDLVSLIQRAGEVFAPKTKLFIGDLGMPAGGPTVGGHASHQSGLDVDIWFRHASPKAKFTNRMRENMSASIVVDKSWRKMKPGAWKNIYGEQVMWFAAQPEVSRIFVNAVIKKQLCEDYGKDDPRLVKVRPWGFHHEHYHVRLNCPAGSPLCEPQSAPVGAECDEESIGYWYSDAKLKELLGPSKRKLEVELPVACKSLVGI